MKLTFSAPSKTFLTGEYAILTGAPALVLLTEPRFEFRAVRGGTGKLTGIPTGSPANAWLKQRDPVWQDWDLEFVDPHEGRGGFGASGAQFLFVHAFATFLQSSVSRATQGMDLKDVWNDYQVLTAQSGSGADLLAQAMGKAALVSTAQGPMAESRPWPFHDLTFNIFRTSDKVPTHEHLKDLDRKKLAPLADPAVACVEALLASSGKDFLKAFKEFSAQLIRLELQTEATVLHIRAFEKESWCLGAKGCGAMGADTILVLCAPSDTAAVQSLAQQRGLTWAADESTISGGLDMKWSWDAD